MVIARIEIELGHHGGNDNDNLIVTKEDFVAYGIHHDSIAPATREAEALGFLRVKRGRGGNAEHRTPSKYGLTFAFHRDSRRSPPTDEWRRVKTVEEAEQIAKAPRNTKDPRAVAYGKFGTRKRKRPVKPGPGIRSVPAPETGTENLKAPDPESGTTGSGRKPGPLSIFRGGEAENEGSLIGHNQGPPWNADDLSIPAYLDRRDEKLNPVST
jgi:hypothetical protein